MKVVLVLNWVGQKGAAHILRNHGWGGRYYFVEFCRDRRLRTFLKVVQKICNIHVQNCTIGEGRLPLYRDMCQRAFLIIIDPQSIPH